MDNQKKITIITVSLNSEQFIEDCICSVLSQDYNNLEYIIIDGKSSDKTLNIIKKYENKIDFLISEKDTGIYDAMNKGINKASGDYIGFLNSDDFYTSDSIISKKMNSIKSNNFDLVYSNVLFSKQNNVNFIIRKYNSFLFHPFFLKFGIMPSHPSSIMKKKLIKECGLFDTNYKIASDFDLFVKIFKNKTIKYKYLNINSVLMRVGGKSNKNFYQIFKLNSEILNSLNKNLILSNILFLFLKIPFKVLEHYYFFISLANFLFDNKKDLYKDRLRKFKKIAKMNNFKNSL